MKNQSPSSRPPHSGGGFRRPRPPVILTPLAAAAALIERVLGDLGPADKQVSNFFKTNPALGRNDRAFVAELVFAVLRRKALFLWMIRDIPFSSKARLLALLGLWSTGQPAPRGLTEHETRWWQGLGSPRSPLPAHMPEECRYNLPTWMIAALRESLGDQLEALIAAFEQPAPLDLRVNTWLVDLPKVKTSLEAGGFAVAPVAGLASALRVEGKPSLQLTEAYTQGWIEVQDLGSQWVAEALDVKRGQTVVDFCAGAGGKTLAIGAAMRNSGRLYALDTSATRLQRLKPRLARSGLSNVWPIAIEHERDPRLKRLAGRADRVLVDAPCSGTGTLRRQPEIKWRLTAEDVARLVQQQSDILLAASRLVKPGGKLVYATCSVLREENAAVVERFLVQQPGFAWGQLPTALSEWSQSKDAAATVQLWPHRHDTDGFYMAVLERSAS